MGNAFVAGPKNEASRGRDMTNEERKSEVVTNISQTATDTAIVTIEIECE